MSLAEQLTRRSVAPTADHTEKARLQCQLAKELEESGDYEAARSAMSELWGRIGERPQLDGLDQWTAAEVLLRAGSLTGWIGSAKPIERAQETAKDLLSESIALFESLQDSEKVAEAQTDLAYCYWREGALGEARVILREVLSRLADTHGELKAIALLRSAIVERKASRYSDALIILTEAAPLVASSSNDALKGKYHNQLAIVLEILSAAERREDYTDRALVEYAAAGFHFEQAGHTRYRAYVENNLGMLFLAAGKFRESHEHLDRARRLFVSRKDIVPAAQVDETRARVLLAEERYAEADAVARAAVRTLEKGDEKSLLAEALTTRGRSLARLERWQKAGSTFARAVAVAEQAGDGEGAGQAALAALEELGERLTASEMNALHERATELLTQSQLPGVHARLNVCARRALRQSAVPDSSAAEKVERHAAEPANWSGFCLKEVVLRFERDVIERALKDAGGVVTRAAQLLGFKHHQTFVALLNSRHSSLLHARRPAIPRRRSIVRLRGPRYVAHHRVMDAETRPGTILHVEDDQLVGKMLREVLEIEGWRVEGCEDGATALQKIESRERYDLLLLDHDLPGVSGLELIRQARALSHLRNTPIIMLSADDCEADSRRAGADAFLQKPADLSHLISTIERLLETSDCE